MAGKKHKIIIGSDHAGFELKSKIIEFLEKSDYEVIDVGTNSPDSVDYPEFGQKVAQEISSGKIDKGILICGTGIGMSMVANRFPKVRAALCNHIYSTIMSRRHNDSNVLIMGGRVIGESLAMEITKTWLETPFEGGRHQKRIDAIDSAPVPAP